MMMMMMAEGRVGYHTSLIPDDELGLSVFRLLIYTRPTTTNRKRGGSIGCRIDHRLPDHHARVRY